MFPGTFLSESCEVRAILKDHRVVSAGDGERDQWQGNQLGNDYEVQARNGKMLKENGGIQDGKDGRDLRNIQDIWSECLIRSTGLGQERVTCETEFPPYVMEKARIWSRKKRMHSLLAMVHLSCGRHCHTEQDTFPSCRGNQGSLPQAKLSNAARGPNLV